MDLNELYKEIEKAEIDLNAKRLKYIKEALWCSYVSGGKWHISR